jgi:BirA family biotin operon repressor/biotin-[acetyl-CoA-carboxylase] ligase
MRIFKFEEIDSTNIYLKNLKEKKNKDVVIAKKQLSGRGRRGNTKENA